MRVFTFRGQPIENANNRTWRAALIRAGIENFRWHDLRHTWATWHRQSGTPTHELQRLGAWQASAMVERYAHVVSDALMASAGRLESFVSGYVGYGCHKTRTACIAASRFRWCPGPESNRYSRFQPTDFKSVVSTNFTTRARVGILHHCTDFSRNPVTSSPNPVMLGILRGVPSSRIFLTPTSIRICDPIP